jgi:hypothetical protein
MNKKILSAAALLLFACLACFAAIADLNGKWSGAFKTPQGDFPVTYTFKVDSGKLTGVAESDQGSIQITDGKINGNDFSFNLDLQGNIIKNVGKFYGDSVTIDVDFSGNNLHANLKRVEDKGDKKQ